jgi:hypothetical protein
VGVAETCWLIEIVGPDGRPQAVPCYLAVGGPPPLWTLDATRALRFPELEAASLAAEALVLAGTLPGPGRLVPAAYALPPPGVPTWDGDPPPRRLQ